MKKLWIIVILIILIVVFGGWSLMSAYAGSVELEDPKILLSVEKGVVLYIHDGSDYIQATGETELNEGDWVKTSQSSEAKIVFYDTQELILDENTEIQISRAMIDENSPFLTQVKIKLKNGQVWTRLLELLHPQASYEVEADNVVATVRGTSFNVKKLNGEVNVSVFENSVGVYDSTNLQDAAVLEPDDFLSYKKSTRSEDKLELSKFQVRKLQAEEKKAAWLKNNIDRDVKFKMDLIQRRNRILKQVGPLPGEKMYKLKRLGEKISMAFTTDPDKKAQLEKNFQIKRMLEVERMVDLDRRTAAVEALNKISINKNILPQIQRVQILDPDFKQKLTRDEDFNTIYLQTMFDKTFRESLLQKLDQLNLVPRYQAENVEKYLDSELVKILRQELVDMKSNIEKLQQTRKDYLLDIEVLAKGTLFEDDKRAMDFEIRSGEIIEKLFEIEKQLTDIQEKQRSLIAELDKMQEFIEYNFNQIKLAKSELDGQLLTIEKDLEQIKTDISDLAQQYETLPATEDDTINLLDIPAN